MVCRVFLETAGWSECEQGAQSNDGIPQNCMFGSEPVDKGFWNVEALRRGGRATGMHGVGKNVLRWFFATSQETGMAFELIIIATLKHDGVPQADVIRIPVSQQTHVIRQTLSEMRELQGEFPQALVFANVMNEWNAHSQWTLAEVNMLAVRASRCKHPDGRTQIVHKCSPGFEPEQWPGGPIFVDPGGGNRFSYDVGPEPGKFRAGWVHPDRGGGWEQFPNAAQVARLRRDARGMPIGASESMYLVEEEDRARAQQWYRGRGWTTNWGLYRQFIEHAIPRLDYFVIHDEKGAQSDPDWPRKETRVEAWAREYFGTGPVPPPPDPVLHYDHLIAFGFELILQRSPGQIGIDVYNPWFRGCYADPSRECMNPFLDVLARSEEYENKNLR